MLFTANSTGFWTETLTSKAGEMDHGVVAAQLLRHRLFVSNVAAHELGVVRDELLPPAREVVVDGDVVLHIEQDAADMRADEARAAGDEHAHALVLRPRLEAAEDEAGVLAAEAEAVLQDRADVALARDVGT
jgi:hypothetical protein